MIKLTCLLLPLLCSQIANAERTGDPAQRPLSETTKKRMMQLRESVESFRLELNYEGEQGKPYYRLIVSVPKVDRDELNAFCAVIEIDRSAALKVIEHLAESGFLDEAKKPEICKLGPGAIVHAYFMTVKTEEIALSENLGWGQQMLNRIDQLYVALPKEKKQPMDLLLGRLSGWRKQWAEQ